MTSAAADFLNSGLIDLLTDSQFRAAVRIFKCTRTLGCTPVAEDDLRRCAGMSSRAQWNDFVELMVRLGCFRKHEGELLEVTGNYPVAESEA